MRNFALIITLLLFQTFSACGVLEKRVGGQEDNFGCYKNAGYTWSTLAEDCVRTFELPIQMDDLYSSTASVTYRASAHLSDDKSKAEVFHSFLKDGSLILTISTAGVYLSLDGKYKLEQNEDQSWRFTWNDRGEIRVLAA